jgi:prevent-host-death family protein
MAAGGWKAAMKKVALADVQENLPKYLRMAEDEDVLITEGGRPAGVLIGFRSEDDDFDAHLESDPRFLARIEQARQELREGRQTAVTAGLDGCCLGGT